MRGRDRLLCEPDLRIYHEHMAWEGAFQAAREM